MGAVTCSTRLMLQVFAEMEVAMDDGGDRAVGAGAASGRVASGGEGDGSTIALVVGTRPEIIKLAHLARELGDRATVVYTGQHYDDALAGSFFDAFGMQRPDAVVQVGGRSRGEQIGVGVEALSRHWDHARPDAVVVQGDTNTALAGALAANALGVPLIHVEAGLRSYDRAMPEEHNRALADRVSDLLLAPTGVSRENLLAERITARIVVTGNTVVEAVRSIMPSPADRLRRVAAHRLEPDGYVVATLHRPENTDDPAQLHAILSALADLPVPVVFPVHPRTRARIESFGLAPALDRLVVTPPMGYADFLALSASAALLVSDSGGIQEEVSVYKRPAVVIRRSTERPEVIGTFATLASADTLVAEARSWLDDLPRRLSVLADLPSPYGDGQASRLSADAIMELLGAPASD
jgi:UDP-N-acetylglucosamine 2-epimerase (non-hydrolysing)